MHCHLSIQIVLVSARFIAICDTTLQVAHLSCSYRLDSTVGKCAFGIKCGGLYRSVVIETPMNLTDKQKELRELEAIIQADSARHNPRARSCMSKVKVFLGQ